MALLSALVIAGYTLVDGVGVRRSGAAASYTLCVFVLTGIPLTLGVLIARGMKFVAYCGRHWRHASPAASERRPPTDWHCGP